MTIQKINARPLIESDLEEVVKVITETLSVRLKKDHVPKTEFDEIVNRYSSENLKSQIMGKYFVVAEEKQGRRLIGVAGLKKDEGSSVLNRLTTFYVLPDYQGQGVGKQLYDYLYEIATKAGCRKLVVDSSPEAELFYEKLGFVKKRVTSKKLDNNRKYYNVWMEQEI